MGLRTTASNWNIPKKYGPYGELVFFITKKEPIVFGEMVDFGHCIPVEAMKACAMCGLRMMEEMSSGTTSEEESTRSMMRRNSMSRTSLLRSWGKVCQEMQEAVLVLPAKLTVAVFRKSLPSWRGCDRMEWGVVGEHRAASCIIISEEDWERGVEVRP